MQLNINANLSFTIDDPSELDVEQVLYNALQMEIRSKDADCNVSVKMHSFTSTSNYTPSVYPLKIQHQSNNSPKLSYLANQPLTITNNNQTLFIKGSNGGRHRFYYNLLLAPLGYDFPPGNYSFTLMFTMTPQ